MHIGLHHLFQESPNLQLTENVLKISCHSLLKNHLSTRVTNMFQRCLRNWLSAQAIFVSPKNHSICFTNLSWNTWRNNLSSTLHRADHYFTYIVTLLHIVFYIWPLITLLFIMKWRKMNEWLIAQTPLQAGVCVGFCILSFCFSPARLHLE